MGFIDLEICLYSETFLDCCYHEQFSCKSLRNRFVGSFKKKIKELNVSLRVNDVSMIKIIFFEIQM